MQSDASVRSVGISGMPGRRSKQIRPRRLLGGTRYPFGERLAERPSNVSGGLRVWRGATQDTRAVRPLGAVGPAYAALCGQWDTTF